MFGLFLGCIGAFAQVSIGNESNVSQPIPFEPYYGYSYTQSIYLASQINTPAGDITALQWYYNGSDALTNSQELVIYMANTDKNNYSDGNDWISSENLTQVYSGGITVNGSGWVTITLDTAFEYNGTDNLVIAVEENMPGYDTNNNFYSSSVNNNQSIFYYNDSENPDPNTPPQGSTITYIPNIIIEGISPTCPAPTNLGVSEITVNSATLTWQENEDAGNYTVAYGYPGFSLEEGSTTTATGTIFELENLSSGTDYEYYVRADCSTDDLSTWSGPFPFVTQCDAVDSFYQDLENATPYDIPNCWNTITDGASLYSYVQTVNYGAYSGNNSILMYNATSDVTANMMLVSPIVSSLTSGTHWLTFNAQSSSEMEVLQIGTLSDPNDASTFNILYTQALTATYQLYTFDLTTYEGTDEYLAIKRTTNTDYNSIYLDDINYETMPTCIYPINITANSITSSEASLSWTSDASSFEYVLNTSEDTPSETPETVSDNTIDFEGLDAFTTYYFHVRSLCEETSISEWVTYEFTTSISNNTCENAITITASNYPTCDAPIAGTTEESTHTANASCGIYYTDVWYSFTPETDGNYYFSTDNASTGVVVWTGDCENLTELASNCSNMISATLTSETMYYVSVLSYEGNPQNFNLCARLLPDAPANDSCEDAVVVNDFPFTETMDASGASNNDGFINICTSSYGVNDGVWYTFTPYTSGEVSINITNVDAWQPEVGVFSGTCGEFVCENFSSTYYDGEDISVNVTVTAGTQYFINVGYNSGYTDYLEGNFTISIDSEDASLASESFKNETNFTYYPNPVNQQLLTINTTKTIQQINVYNLLGQNVLAVTPNMANYTLNMSDLTAGSYLLQVTVDGTTETVKIIKQ
ncbi:Por secretion system C-terminal sorting domain-containing protein [Pustulibacterium marinum]|uniref:Por secretion system C-terminal sorting domain-containing protein n=2 Tax=Pustulibacterium marinum TaxID=1224947 RepID=A0A1I7ITA9_9FLAO|nr:Por secretion system C-terminal sorting domain-containing protein [Pustulibacterium marinum]